MTDKPPSAYAVEAVMSAWQRGRAQILRDNPDMTEADLNEWLGPEKADVDEIQTRLIRKWREAKGTAAWLKQECADLGVRKARAEARQERLRAILMETLFGMGKPKHTLPIATFWVGFTKPGLRVTDETAIPDEYFETVVTKVLKEDALLDDLKQGVVVKGAALSNPMPYLTIKVN